jgi:hypothetical protein
MGLGADFLQLFTDLKDRGQLPEGRSVAEVGAQQLAASFLSSRAELAKLGTLFNVGAPSPLPDPAAQEIVHGSLQHLAEEAPRARLFWEWLGYRYASIDIDNTPGNIFLDLNFDAVPDASRKQHAIVTNFGTTEHVANQANAFKVIHDLTALQGLMIHELPAQGMHNHGLVNYNPKFFWMLARSNGYVVVHFDFRSDSEPYGLPQNIIDYSTSHGYGERRDLGSYRASDCYLMVVLRKVFDTEYVPPVDVPTGVETSNPVLRKRYWSVFSANPFAPGGAKMLPYLLSRLYHTPPSRWWTGLRYRLRNWMRK